MAPGHPECLPVPTVRRLPAFRRQVTMRGIVNLVIGVLILAGALTGHLVLVSNSPQAHFMLPAVGGTLTLLGLYRMTRRRA